MADGEEYKPSFSHAKLTEGESLDISFPHYYPEDGYGWTGFTNIGWSITGITTEDIDISAGKNQTLYEHNNYISGIALIPTHINQDAVDNGIQITAIEDNKIENSETFTFNLGVNVENHGSHITGESFFTKTIPISDMTNSSLLITGPSGIEGDADGYIAMLENQDFVFDFDANKQVSWSVDGDDENYFEIDSSTGALFFNNTPSFLSQASRNGDNIYELAITASLENSPESTQSLEISIEDDPSDNFGSINTFGPHEDVIRLSSGNGSNSLLSGDGRYVIDNGSWEVNRRGHQLLKNRFTGEYSVVDSTKEGDLSTGDSQHILDISSDGRYALFTLDEYGSVDLDGLPGMGGSDMHTGESREYGPVLYRKDLIEGDVIPVNTTSEGTKVAAGAGRGAMTPDGRYVAFVSDVQLAGLEKPPWGSDEYNRNVIYRKDLETGDLIIVSKDKDGNLNTGYIGGEQLGISDDGSRISFFYQGDDLLEAPRPIEYDELGWEISPPYWSQDLLIKDLESNEIILASSDSNGVRLEDFGKWGSGNPIAPDGNSVIFTSGGANGTAQLYSKNLIDGGLTLLSKTPKGEEGNGYSSSHGASFSSNSRFIAYQTSASNLLGEWTPDDPEWNPDLVNYPGPMVKQWKDSNNVQDIYVFDTKTGENRRLLDGIANEFSEHIRDPFISNDGKLITFRTDDDFMPGSIGYETYLAKSPFISELDDALKIEYKLFEANASNLEIQSQGLSQQAVLGDSVKYDSKYRLDLTAESINSGYITEAADISISFDPLIFGAVNASDITIGGALPIANAIQINNEAGIIRIAAASLADLKQGNGISANSPLASINLDFDEEQIKLLEKNEDGSLKINPLSFQITANDQETVFSKTFTDDSGLTNREIVSLADLGGGIEVTGQDVTLYEAKVNLAQQGDGLVLGTQRVIGSDASITNLVRSGDTLTTSAEWLNVGNIQANNLSYESLYNQNASLVSADFSKSSIASGSFIDGVFVNDARESTVLTTDIKITGEAGNVVDLADGIVSVQADAEGSQAFSNQGKGSKNLITFQGDLNYDGRVSMKDLAYLNAGAARQQLVTTDDQYGSTVEVASEASYARDVDADFSGKIDLADLSVLDADWGKTLHTGDEQFQGSGDVSWSELDSQGDSSTWENDSFKDQNAIEAEDSYAGSLESPTAGGVIGADGNTTSNDNDITGPEFQDPIPA